MRNNENALGDKGRKLRFESFLQVDKGLIERVASRTMITWTTVALGNRHSFPKGLLLRQPTFLVLRTFPPRERLFRLIQTLT